MKNIISIFRQAWLHSSIILMLCPFCLVGGQNVQEALNTIPKHDKEAIEKLFYSLFNGEHFSYTLFGDKPMSWTNYSTEIFDSDDFLSLSELKFRKRWKTWKKYAELFPMTRYLLIESSSNASKRDILDFAKFFKF